ncbi:MAG: D-alanyl-D-alanine carboxypeptidase [Clostridia bacterium]|nr:D-alanyl-D-alanine carboxypeptidase [Clostridia bacterium]
MNHQNKQQKSPNSGPEIRQLTFLAVILAVLLVLVLGGFFLVQLVIVPLLDQNNTPPIEDTPGSNLTETVTGEQAQTPGEDQPSWFESIWAGILDLFSPTDSPDDPSGNFPGIDPDATYPFAGNASGGSVIPVGNGASIADETTYSQYSIVVNASTGQVTASEQADARMYPASMTKVMTLLVAVEHLQHESSLQDKIKVSEEIRQNMVNQGSSGVGFDVGEELTVEGMLYATLLQSDGIAATELAVYIAGSEQAFVDLMNEKARELGLADTHFTNPTGLHDANHYSTCRDMAAIMIYAMNNELCAKIMSTELFSAQSYWPQGDKMITYSLYHSYLVTKVNNYKASYPYGAVQPTTATITAAKTGYTEEGKYCLVTYAKGNDGNGYVCVTGFAAGSYNYVDDHVALYNKYAK